MTPQTPETLPPHLVWLADAPLFIDADHVGRFYDAVARPQAKQGAISLELSQENITAIKGKLNIEGTLTTEKLAGLLAPVFAFLKPTLKAGGEAEAEENRKHAESTSMEFLPISTPQRDLVALAIHYLINHPHRLFFVHKSTDEEWRSPGTIAQVPRSIAFLNLPGEAEAKQSGLPATKLIPTAAEFANGKIVQIYKDLRFTDDELPAYPERAGSLDELKMQRKNYWQWFDLNYSATKAMIAVEEAAGRNGRINWIDYRLPISSEGDTLHLHVCPGGKYDTGVLAYNFIKRGYKHGIRLVGTLKSEPDMNVLAVYER